MRNIIKTFLLFFLVQLTLLAIPRGLQAQVDPSIKWKEIETETAYWLFDARHQGVAEYYILQFERARQQLLPIFREEPRKTTILLLDNTDRANGSAQVAPHPIISLFTVQPEAYSSIGDFRDYVHELLVHEYTHILNMEPVHGWISPMYWIFGSIAHPNMMLPRWYTEGLAVYTESEISKDGGRLNSQYLGGLARSLTLQNRWDDFPLSQINDGHLDWLGGSRAYLFGGILWDSIAKEKGSNEILYKFNQSYSRRVPYFLDGVIESNLGVNYQEQLAKAYTRWKIAAQKQIDVISKEPHLPGEELPLGEEGVFVAPSISPDGLWMAFTSHNLDGTGHINLILRHPKKGFRGYRPKRIIPNVQARNVAWHPAATGFVYEKLERYNFYNNYYDLYFYDLRTRKSKRLTEGLRAHNACFTPLGKTLYFFAHTPGSKKIMAMDWITQKTETIYQAPIGDDLRSLNCSDKEELYFIEHKPGKKSHIVRYQVPAHQKDVIFDKFDVHFLKKTHLGLLFTSPESGVDNAYLLGENGTPKAITNSLTRVLKADLDPLDDGLYFSQSNALGARIHYLKGAQWESLPDSPPKVEPLFTPTDSTTVASGPADDGNVQMAVDKPIGPQLDKQQELKKEEDRNPQATTKHTAEDFSPWRYLVPNHWIPFLYFVDSGTLYQATTTSGDPLGINNFSLVGQWDTLTKKAGASASYVNNSLPVSIGGGVSDFHNFFYATRTTLHFSNVTGLLAGRLAFLDDTRWLFRWNYSALEFHNSFYIRQGPQLELSYSTAKRKPRDISPSSGWRTEVGHKNYLADFGSVSYGETYAHLGTFWNSFMPWNHVFYLGINGSYAPQLNNSFFATSTLAGPFLNPQITNTSFLQRGYPTGIFVARNIVNTNAEYRFPIYNLYRGWTAPPLFFRNLQGAFVFDASTLDGLYSDSFTKSAQFTDFGRWFTGYGLELESMVNVGFHVPVAFTLGLYYGEEQQSYGGFTTFFNIRL